MRAGETERGYSLAMVGLLLILAGFGLLVFGAVDYQSVAETHECVSESGNGGHAGGSRGQFGPQLARPSRPAPGRCAANVNGVFVEAAEEDFDAAVDAVQDRAWRRDAA